MRVVVETKLGSRRKNKIIGSRLRLRRVSNLEEWVIVLKPHGAYFSKLDIFPHINSCNISRNSSKELRNFTFACFVIDSSSISNLKKIEFLSLFAILNPPVDDSCHLVLFWRIPEMSISQRQGAVEVRIKNCRDHHMVV